MYHFNKMFIYIFLIINFLFIFILILADVFKYKINYENFLQRFIFNYKKKKILFHSCSIGETKSLEFITKYFDKENIDYYLSIHTPTAYQISKNFTEKSILKPYDNFFFMFLFFLQIKPKVLIICESDLWPWYIFFALLFKTKIFFINHSIKFDKPIRNIIYNFIATKIFLNKKINIPFYLKNKYKFLDNLKLLNHNFSNNNFKKIKNSVVFASAYLNELEYHIKLFKLYKNKIIIYVPRHLNFKESYIKKLKNYNIKYKFTNYLEEIKKNQINIFWKFGILNEIYKLTEFTIMGGTLNNIGGHNIIEPISKNNIVYVGKNIFNINEFINIFKIQFINFENDNLNYNSDIIKYNNNVIKNKINNKNIYIKEILKIINFEFLEPNE